MTTVGQYYSSFIAHYVYIIFSHASRGHSIWCQLAAALSSALPSKSIPNQCTAQNPCKKPCTSSRHLRVENMHTMVRPCAGPLPIPHHSALAGSVRAGHNLGRRMCPPFDSSTTNWQYRTCHLLASRGKIVTGLHVQLHLLSTSSALSSSRKLGLIQWKEFQGARGS